MSDIEKSDTWIERLDLIITQITAVSSDTRTAHAKRLIAIVVFCHLGAVTNSISTGEFYNTTRDFYTRKIDHI